MATRFVDKQTKCDCLLQQCSNVVLCMSPEWANKTVSGYPILYGKINTITKVPVSYTDTSCCTPAPVTTDCGCGTIVTPAPANPNTCLPSYECRYHIEIDGDQIKIDPGTGVIYDVSADSIYEMFPYPCMAEKLFDAAGIPSVSADAGNILVAGVDEGAYLDCDIVNACAYPLISTDVGNILVEGGDSKAYLNCDIVNACAYPLISADVGNILVEGGDSKAYLNCAAVATCSPPLTVVTGDIGADYAIASASVAAGGGTTTLTINGADEHDSIAESVFFVQQSYVGAVAVATLQTGDSTIKTPAYVETTFNNPSATRAMAVQITATGSFAIDIASGTGFAVFGHSLWVDGVLIATRNGRTLPGFNVVSEDSNNLLDDHDLPVIVYNEVLPAGGSITVGLDFGDNDTLVTIGTVDEVSVESRTISISGSTVA